MSLTRTELNHGWRSHPVMMELGPHAVVWLFAAVDYCATNKTDGFISQVMMRTIFPPANFRIATTNLLENDILSKVDGGYQIANYIRDLPNGVAEIWSQISADHARKENARFARDQARKRACKKGDHAMCTDPRYCPAIRKKRSPMEKGPVQFPSADTKSSISKGADQHKRPNVYGGVHTEYEYELKANTHTPSAASADALPPTAENPKAASHSQVESSRFRVRVEYEDEHNDVILEPLAGTRKSWAADVLGGVEVDPELRKHLTALAEDHGCQGTMVRTPLCRAFLDEEEPSLTVTIADTEGTKAWLANVLRIAERIADASLNADPEDIYGVAL